MTTPTAAPSIDPGIFKAYDIRGVVDKTLTEAAARAIGRASARWAPRAA
jgi:phosphomannomutase